MKNKKEWLFSVIGAVVLAALLCGILFSGERMDTAEETLPAASASADTPKKLGFFRVLIWGVDRASGLSDGILLVSLDRDTGEAFVLQLPRDTYAAYTTRSYRKLNGAPGALGLAEATAFVGDALGLSIDRYVRISLDTVGRAVDAVGGVTVTLRDAWDYEDPSQGLSIHLPAGTQTLDGKAAEQFVRFRSGYLRGDLDRMDAQKVFLITLFDKFRSSLTPQETIRLGAVLLDGVKTNVTLSDLLWLIPEVYALRSDRLWMATAPGEAAVGEKSGASYYILSRPSMERLLTERLGAAPGGFDASGVFLHESYQPFRELYEKEVRLRLFSAAAAEP